MRRFLFGWICTLRGEHVARKPKRLLPFYNAGTKQLIGCMVEFHCICGATNRKNHDYTRGGRIPVPFAWPTEKCL